VKTNPQKRAVMWFVLAAVGLLMFVLPIMLGIEEYHGGFVLGFLGFVLLVTAIIAGIACWLREKRLDRLVSGDGLIVHWKYSSGEWREYAEIMYRRKKRERWRIIYLLAGILLSVCIAFAIFRPDSLLVMLIVLFPLLLLSALVTVIVFVLDYRRARDRTGEVFIGKDGIYLDGEYYSWKMAGGRLEGVTCVTGEGTYLEFRYSGRSGYAGGNYVVRVPVPLGQEDSAKRIAAKFGSG